MRVPFYFADTADNTVFCKHMNLKYYVTRIKLCLKAVSLSKSPREIFYVF